MSNHIYPAVAGDRGELQKIEIKCYDYPLTFEAWGEILSDKGGGGEFSKCKCSVYKRNSTILGYAVYGENPTEPDQDLEVLRLGVLPSVRNQGIGKMLVDHLQVKAHSKNMNQAQIMIPEYLLDPQENRNIHDFVATSGLVLHRHEREAYFHYGKFYDGIVYRTGGIAVPIPA